MADVDAPRNAPNAPTITFTDLTRVAVTLTGTYPTGADVTEYGFQWSQDGFETYKTEKNPQMTDDGTFIWTTTSLEASSSYLFRSYITNGISTRYSTNCPINTPSTSNATLTDVTIQNGFVTATIVDSGGRNITEVGFLCGETDNKSELKRSKRQLAESTTGTTFTKALSSFDPPLEPGGTYYFLAYAEDETDAFGYSPTPQEYVVTAIKLDKSAIEFNVGDSQTLTARFLPEGTPAQSLTWTSSNEEVATVTQGGVVTAIALGECVVIASSGGLADSCIVSISGIPVTSIEFDESAREVYVSENFTLKASVFPLEATNKTLTWSSSDEEVATVAQDGSIVPKSPGTATILATAVSGAQASFNCIVVSEAPVFPDENFKKYVYDNFDTNRDGFLSRSEVVSITSINVNTDDIESLSGIEYFSNLTSLDCSGSFFSRENGPTGKIVELDCSNNLQLNKLICNRTAICSINIEENKQLFWVEINDSNLTSISIGQKPALSSLYIINNPISEIDLSSCERLSRLEIEGCELSTLILPKSSLLYLNVANNNLTSIDLSNFQELQSLIIGGNNLNHLDISNNPYLKMLNCDAKKTARDQVSSGSYAGITVGMGTSLESIDISNNAKIEELICSNNSLSVLNVNHLTNLRTLHCMNNKLTSLDVSNNTKLYQLWCNDNNISLIDLTHNDLLYDLNCSSNLLESLDLSNNTDLFYLSCDSNRLDLLDLSNNQKLYWVFCNSNDLTSLSVANNADLYYLHCQNNKLSFLDVSNNSKLLTLLCGYNQLAKLNVSNNVSLSTLWCSNNQLTSLDVSNNLSLSSLICDSNPNLGQIWLKTGQIIPIIQYDSSIATIKYKE